MRQTILGGLWLAAATAALAQPVLRPDSITNAASNLPVLAPNAALAQGGMFIVKGQRLGPRGIIIANSFPLQINMGGTQIRLTVGGTTMAAYMVYVVGDNNLRDDQGQYDQLAGIVPSNMPTGGGMLEGTIPAS